MIIIIIIITVIKVFVPRDPYSLENHLNCCEVVKVDSNNSVHFSIIGIH